MGRWARNNGEKCVWVWTPGCTDRHTDPSGHPPKQGCVRREGGGGHGGVWYPKVCVPQMARQDFPKGKFRFFPHLDLWGGGGASMGECPPPMVCGHSNTSLPPNQRTSGPFKTHTEDMRKTAPHDTAATHHSSSKSMPERACRGYSVPFRTPSSAAWAGGSRGVGWGVLGSGPTREPPPPVMATTPRLRCKHGW